MQIDFSDIIDAAQPETGPTVFKALCEGVYDKKISLFDMGENTLTPESVEDCRPIIESDHMRDLLLVNSDLSGPSMIQLTVSEVNFYAAWRQGDAQKLYVYRFWFRLFGHMVPRRSTQFYCRWVGPQLAGPMSPETRRLYRTSADANPLTILTAIWSLTVVTITTTARAGSRRRSNSPPKRLPTSRE